MAARRRLVRVRHSVVPVAGANACAGHARATEEPPVLVARILLLHYLARADGTHVTGKWVGYKDIPGGLLYASVFERRVTNPLAKKFGNSKKVFAQAGLKMGGRPVEIGDTSFILQAFPFVPLQYVLWEGDDEFPPKVQLLFDSSVDHYLSLEDVVVLGQLATGRLIHQSQLLV